MIDRPLILDGVTYYEKLPDGKPMYVTINNYKGIPFEVFIRMDDPNLFEWVVALTVIITRALRAGELLSTIATALDAKMPPTPGVNAGLIQSAKQAATSRNVLISQ